MLDVELCKIDYLEQTREQLLYDMNNYIAIAKSLKLNEQELSIDQQSLDQLMSLFTQQEIENVIVVLNITDVDQKYRKNIDTLFCDAKLACMAYQRSIKSLQQSIDSAVGL